MPPKTTSRQPPKTTSSRQPPKTTSSRQPPKTTSSRQPAKTTSRQPQVRRGRIVRSDRSKRTGKRRQKRRKLPLKGWLETPADWARFNAWAEINALPRKIAEPETIVRESKPLSYFKERLVVLAEPTAKFDTESICRLDLSVSKSALTAKPSKRIRELAKFAWRYVEPCKEMPNPISKAALRYKASRRLIEISRPIPDEFEECKTLEVSRNALRHKTTDRENEMSSAKRVDSCPNTFSDKERRKLYTPDGVRKSALSYNINDWISILALPSYRFLKDRRDSEARKMKKQLEENEDRGRKVLDEQRRKEEKKAREGGKKSKKKGNNSSKQQTTEEDKADSNTDTDEKKRKKKQAWRKEPGPCKERPLDVSKAALNAKASARTEEIAKPHIHESKSCRTNPFAVKKSALSGKASSRTEEIAKPVNPLEPVEKAPPREIDEFGAPIFPKPKYGKVLPKVKPYKMGECKDKEEEEKPRQKYRRKMKPIALFPSIDPCLDPNGAKKQAKAREVARNT